VFLNFYLTAIQYSENLFIYLAFPNRPGSPQNPTDVVIELRRGNKLFGYGWLVFKDNENVYVMTSNSVLRLIKSNQVDNALEIVVFRSEGEPANYDATVTNDDFVAVRSNEDSALDYVVLKLKTSHIVQELPPQVSKASLEPGEIVFERVFGPMIPSLWQFRVQPYPEDLVDWLKSSASSSSSNIPTTSCEPSINFDDAKYLKQIIIALPNLYSRPGIPIMKYLDDQVAAMSSSIVFINHDKTKEHFISFGVSMPRIIDDIRRKKPSEAKKWFPNYFD
jgi:hypothetical protein